jgi:CRP/FNR family cyclic AMP-dependent transcriptional regulator
VSNAPCDRKKKKERLFDPDTFLATIGEGRKILVVPKKQTIFAQGDEADGIFYIQKGRVRLTVVSETGKEATIAILDQGIFWRRGACRSGSPHGIRRRNHRL